MKKIITSLTVIVLFVFAIGVINQLSTEKMSAKQQHETHAQKTVELAQKTEHHDLTHEEMVELTDMFMTLLVQDVDNHYKVIRFDTKEELIGAFDPYVTKEAVQPYIDYYYHEKADGLYIVPTETPPWFGKEKDYDKVTKDRQVTVTQTTENELHGKYTIETVFKEIDGTWKIANISHK